MEKYILNCPLVGFIEENVCLQNKPATNGHNKVKPTNIYNDVSFT